MIDLAPWHVPDRPDGDDGKTKILTVGDGDFGYSKALAANNPNWQIVGTSYGNGSNFPILEGFYGRNLVMYRNVDATRLQTNPAIMGEQFDAVVFNNPRPITGWSEAGMRLVDNALSSASHVLKPGGEMRFSGTWRMPASPYLNSLVKGWPPPNSYSNSYTMGYFADPLFGVPYQPIRNEGNSLQIDLMMSKWYVFVK
jgi:hypothetical protein